MLRWTEDKEIVKALLEKTVKGFTPGDNSSFRLFELSVSWEEDVDFMERLFSETHNLPEKYRDLIANNTRNWEVDRLPLTDRVVLEMAIGELMTFPNIPVKVTINEYIELTKHYSTPNSRQFVNGILDVIAKALTDAGDLKKSGRGLIDNK
ncbi:MAG: transcription antitermination factor NusB [Bacteroidia bacterium]|nr:transcription antitermination factor NusB [Bacteroidia bacterium]